MAGITYFFHNSPKKWDLTEAFLLYDEANTFESFEQLLDAVLEDLLNVQKKQDPLKEYIEATIERIQNLKQMACLRREIKPVAKNVAVEKITNHGELELNVINNIKHSGKRKERDDDTVNVYTQNSPSRHLPTARKEQDGSSSSVPFEDYKCSLERPNRLVLTHGKKQYTINTPSKSKYSPHRPKLTKSHVDALKGYVKFATNAMVTADESVRTIYESHREGQRSYHSLKHLELYDEIKDILDNIPFDNFPATLWRRQSQSNKEAKRFISIVQYMLTSFHLLCNNQQSPSTNHERTFFIEYCVPGLLALAKTTDILSFHWCEFELQAMKDISMYDSDFNMLKTPKRYLDALGKMRSLTNMETVIVEASSGGLEENVTHTVEDTIKTIECATASLQSVAMRYKHASITTLKKLQIFSIHIVKDKMTLTATMLNDAYTWNRIDLRSATIPTKWDDRICLLQYFELLATLMNGLEECAYLEYLLKRENIGVEPFDGKTIADYLAIE